MVPRSALREIVRDGGRAAGDRRSGNGRATHCFAQAKQYGFSDRQLATIWRTQRDGRPRAAQAPRHRGRRSSRSIPAPPSSRPTRRTTTRPTKTKTKRRPSSRGKQRIMILGGGPNRIGQGIEFDYCCCHASFALRELGIESIMVNSQPGDGQHRLRHQRPALLRAADDRGRAQHLRPHAARRRDRAVRRADAAEPGPGAAQRRRADHRHQRRHDRSGRRPREVRSDSRSGWACKQPANGIARTMDQARAEAAQDRLPGAGAAELRARRPGDGDLLRRWPSSSGSWPRRSSSPRGSRC